MTTIADTTPYWSASTTFPRFAKLDADTEADVVVVGGRDHRPDCRLLPHQAGRSVLLMDRGRCATGDTGHTSAHLTMVTDTRFHDLVKQLGRDHAQAVWDAGISAIAQIDDIVREHANRLRVRLGRGLPPPAAGRNSPKDATA